MNLSVGIVGLPNVGKSTLFNALLKKQQALAANYPFATIEPNVGIVAVPDSRLEKLAIIVGGGDPHASLRKAQDDNIILPPIKPATVEFYDIAGLVKGASTGEGLGNKFLSHIRETKIIAHVVRAFEDADVIKEGAVDPKSDYEVINAELILADLATAENVRSKVKKFTSESEKSAIKKLVDGLNSGKPAREIAFEKEEQDFISTLFLLSSKPEIVVLNVSENQYNPKEIESIIKKFGELLSIDRKKLVVICAKIESELSELSEAEQKEYLKDLGLESSGLERLIQKAYQTLGLISFLTAGEKEVRAWTIRNGSTAPEAAGEIHTEFTKKFIKAEVVGFDDFVVNNGWKGSREKGKARLEGKEYIMKDGDVVEFKIGS
ncbi:MAG TPA: redox-regulated ATPase YchF [Candidatus Saccharimonadales bacterium]|nr:redox-regulated ATPase YchF [Candidatus Saccharimonadales bacterium]